MRLGLPTIVFLLTIGSLGGVASDPTYPLDAVLRGSDPIQTTGALTVSDPDSVDGARSLIRFDLDPEIWVGNATFVTGSHVDLRGQTLAMDYGLPLGGPLPGASEDRGIDRSHTNLVLNLTLLRPEAQALVVLSGRSSPAVLEASGASCGVRHRAPDENMAFPGWTLPPEYNWLTGECRMAGITAESEGWTILYGMDLWLLSDEEDQGKLICTGKCRERDEAGIEREVTRVLWIESSPPSPRVPYALAWPHAGSLTFFAHDFLNAGTVSVGPSTGNLSWGEFQTQGEVGAFNATGALTLAWAPDQFIEFNGTTLNGHGGASSGALAPAGEWAAVALVSVAAAGTLALVAWFFWVLFSKIAPDRVLDHPRRVAILDYVRSEPGVETNTVCRSLGLHWMAAQHHIRTLQRAGHISLARVGGRTALFPAKAGFRGLEIRTALLRRESSRRLLAVLHESPGLDQAALAARLGLSRQGVSKAIRTLVVAGLVREVDGPSARRYFVADPAAL